MAESYISDPKALSELVELMKLDGTEYMLIDNGTTSMKIKVDTILGYISNEVIKAAMPIPLSCPVGTVITCTSSGMENKLKISFGGTWSSTGTSVVGSTTLHYYTKTSGTDAAGGTTGSSSSGSGIVVIPEGETLPAASRTDGTFYLNVMNTVEAHMNNGLPASVRISSNMGLKILE